MQATRILAATFAGAALLAGCSKQEVAAPAPRAVIAQVVGAKAAASANVYSGEVRARYENDLAFRVGGKVVVRFVDVGATVKKGQSLARLDPQDAQLGVESARSQLAAARGRPRARQDRARSLSRSAREEIREPGGARRARDDLQHHQGPPRAGAARSRQVARTSPPTPRSSPRPTASSRRSTWRPARSSRRPAGDAVRQARGEGSRDQRAREPARRAARVRARSWSRLAAPDKPYLGRVREIAPNADPPTRTFAAKISVDRARRRGAARHDRQRRARRPHRRRSDHASAHRVDAGGREARGVGRRSEHEHGQPAAGRDRRLSRGRRESSATA